VTLKTSAAEGGKTDGMADVLGIPQGFAPPPRRRSRTVMAVVVLVLVLVPVLLFPLVVAMAYQPAAQPVPAARPIHA
jgi:hypothetical protein